MTPSRPPPPVRRAVAADLPRLVATLARAAAARPWERWTIAADDRERRLRELFELVVGEVALPFGEVWTTESCDAVAVWTPPDAGGAAAEAMGGVAPRVEELMGDRAPAAAAGEELLEPYRPWEPGWTLESLAVDSDVQRGGLGSAVIAPVLDRADATRLPAYVEISTPVMLAFYRRHGFQPEAEITIPSGPSIWMLTRFPRRIVAR